jgi:hypothetical protein
MPLRRRHFAAMAPPRHGYCLFASFHATPRFRQLRRRIRRLLLILSLPLFSRHAVISQRHFQPDIDTFHAATPPLIAMPLPPPPLRRRFRHLRRHFRLMPPLFAADPDIFFRLFLR